MDFIRKNTNSKLLTCLIICVVILCFFVCAASWQYIEIARKDYKIGKLLTENESLKKNLSSIDADLLEIKDAASDVRIFQKELVKVIKDIDPSLALSFARKAESKPSCGFSDSVDIDHQASWESAKESIFLLSSSQEKLRFDTASLLGKAVSIRDAISTTPSLFPVSGGYISSDFGPRIDPITGAVKRHNGIDIAAPIGTPVYVSADGIVKRATFDREFGNIIEVLHPDGYRTIYGHLSEILTKINARVKRGELIGRVGKTGLRCAGAHLHFGIDINGVKQNPKKFPLRSPHNV